MPWCKPRTVPMQYHRWHGNVDTSPKWLKVLFDAADLPIEENYTEYVILHDGPRNGARWVNIFDRKGKQLLFEVSIGDFIVREPNGTLRVFERPEFMEQYFFCKAPKRKVEKWDLPPASKPTKRYR